ncbi:TetR family transcriptional regulator [Curtobacterium sp. 'Ferrero']|uniref:TetR/AcrR family transcriptional regulator n=1 Tax=Curtobacterium sp. 'Ferrero' TaxID=2033654 RepID=UPI000BC9DA31|nr:TetR/AcrR family transcriptional regulator [Curtobacterium sp. 'Ferrero']PCN48597.1 TetR family transcriptional regulator [Curtobacterium sp. 'Ferrero']
MVRWQPGTRERLQATAMQLFADQGYDATTVAEIARAAEVTERTFFRHFADKREVLFAGQADFLGVFTHGIDEAPADAPAFELVRRALGSAGTYFDEERRPFSRARQAVIDGESALQERELGKLQTLKIHLGALLRDRAVPEPTATIAAETAVTVFHLSFQQWIAPDEDRSFAEVVAERLAALTDLVHPGH